MKGFKTFSANVVIIRNGLMLMVTSKNVATNIS